VCVCVCIYVKVEKEILITGLGPPPVQPFADHLFVVQI